MITIGTVSISRNPTVDSHFWHKRLNQTSEQAADGALITYDNGPTVLEGEIVLEGVSRTQAEAFRTWLQSTAVYSLNTFTITLNTAPNTDIGAGPGVAISGLKYNGEPSTEDVIKWSPPDVYSIVFPYRKVV